MSVNELKNLIETLNEWESVIEEAKSEAEYIRDQIKAEMLAQNTEELEVENYIIRYTSVLSNRFDTTAFKKVMPDVYKAYTKQVAGKRFTISA